LQFGETAIDLTKANVFPTGTCTAFGSAFVRSRSSASFTAEIKDFIAPIPVNISNCGQVTIIKHTDPRGINQDFSYTSTIPDPSSSSATDCTQSSADPTPSSFTLNDNGNTTGDSTANTENCIVAAGSYTVNEGAEPPNFTLESLTCTDNGVAGSGGSQDGANPSQADITITPGGHVTCTYVNQQHLGAIKITKTGKDKNCTGAGTPSISNGVCTGAGTVHLTGAVFSVKDSNGNPVSGSPVTTGADGTVCVDHLPFGNYSVQETSAPNGYAIDDTTAHTVSVNTNSTCGDGNEATFSVSDTPLTNLTVNAQSQLAGATNSTITCVDSANAGIGNSPQGPSDPAKVTANDLKPGTYTCTVVIDP
jgi:Prealbumin-like fold domain